MIDDVSRTLQAILDDATLGANFPELLAANVVFDRPDESFTPQAPAAINLFLYEIRENVELRSNEPVITRAAGQATITQPPRRIDCSYLVTAWPVGAGPPAIELREHQLLGQALQLLAGLPVVPPNLLQGSLAGQTPPLPMITPQAETLKSPAEFWTAMGNKLRAAFTVTVTISMPVLPPSEAPLVSAVRQKPPEEPLPGKLPVSGPSPNDTEFRIGGRVFDAATDNPVVDADVLLVQLNQTTKTDTRGVYSLGVLSPGNYTLEVTHPDFTSQSKSVVVPPASPTDYDVGLPP